MADDNASLSGAYPTRVVTLFPESTSESDAVEPNDGDAGAADGVLFSTRADDDFGDPPAIDPRGLTTHFSSASGSVTRDQSEDDHLIAMLAHELRTPLTSIKGFAQLAVRLNSAGPESVKKYMQIVVDECDRMAATLSDLVQTTHDETIAVAEAVDLGRAAANAIERLRGDRSIELDLLSIDLAAPWPKVAGNTEQMTRLMAHFLRSSLKYADGLRPVAIAPRVAGSEVVVAAELGGTGVLERVGHLFREGDEVAEENQASGLALYICKKFIESRGGRMWMEKTANDGARICFSLPITGPSAGG